MAYKRKTMTVKKLARQVQKLKSVPDKKVSLVNTSTGPNTTGSIQPLHTVAAGTGSGQRIGDKIQPISLNFKCYFEANASAVGTLGKVLIIQDKQQVSDTQPSVGDVIYNLGTNNFLAIPNYENLSRFRILAKHTFTQDGTNPKYFEKNLKLSNPIMFNGAATTDIQKNGIYVIFISNQLTFTPIMRWCSYMLYTDQ